MATATIFHQVKRPPPGIYRDIKNRLAELAVLLEERCQTHVHAGGSELESLLG